MNEKNLESQKGNSKINKTKVKVTEVSRPFGTAVDNFYITDFVSENSAIMAKASKVRLKNTFFKDKSLYN
jgi:hypothetical protein